MAANQTNVHKKMDKILQKLNSWKTTTKHWPSRPTTWRNWWCWPSKYSARQHQESQAMLREMGQISLKVKESSAGQRNESRQF